MQEKSVYRVVKPSDEQLVAYELLAQESFFIPDSEQPRITRLLETYRDKIFVLLKGDDIVGGLFIPTWGYYFGGNVVEGTGVSLVAVAPEFRRKGVASRLMQEVLDQTHAMGLPISVLLPANYEVYNKAGYELSLDRLEMKVPLANLTHLSSDYHVRRMKDEDIPRVKAIREKMISRYNGNVSRTDEKWGYIFSSEFIKKEKYVFELNGDINAYAVIHPGRREPRSIHLEDYGFCNGDAGLALLTHISRYTTMRSYLTLSGSHNDPLLRLVPEVMYDAEQMMYAKMMLRIIDVKKALEARGYLKTVSGSVSISISDDGLMHNNGCFSLCVKNGKASVERVESAEVELDIRGLAALYSGAFSASELDLMGKINASEKAINILDALFAGFRPWISDMF